MHGIAIWFEESDASWLVPDRERRERGGPVGPARAPARPDYETDTPNPNPGKLVNQLFRPRQPSDHV